MKRDSTAQTAKSATSQPRRFPASSTSASIVKQTAETCAINQTSPSIAHHKRSVPASKKAQIHALAGALEAEALAQFPRGTDRNRGEHHREKRLIRLRAEDRNERKQEQRRERRFDHVVTAAIVQGVDVGTGPVDPRVPVQQRLGEQDVVVIRGGVKARNERGNDERYEAGNDRRLDASQAHYGGSVACGSGAGCKNVDGGRFSGKR